MSDFAYDILSNEYAKRLSTEEFDKMFRGQTRTKFKMIVNPDNGKLYRLVFGIDGKTPYYAEMEPKPTVVYEYALADEKKEEYRALQLPPLAEPYALRSYKIQLNPNKKPQENEISRQQMFELERAVSMSSRWWPLEGLSWSSVGHLHNTEMNILFNQETPIGFIAIEDCPEQNGKPVKAISMVGLMPGQQSKGHGSYLMKWAMHRILGQNPETRITLTTSDSDKKQSGKPAKDLYEKLGFVLQSSTLVDPAKMIAENRQDLGKLDLYNAYAPDTYDDEPGTGRKLPRFRQEELARRVDSVFTVREKI